MRVSKRPDERRGEIIQAAKELFASNGFMKTTISDIARKTGVAKGLFYYYFKTKDEVVNAVIEEYIASTEREVIRIARQQDIDYRRRLNEVIFAIIDFSRDAENVFAELRRSDRYMFHQSLLEHAVERLKKTVATMVDEGVEKEIIRCRYPHIMVEILFYGLGMIDFVNMDKIQVAEIVEQALNIAPN